MSTKNPYEDIMQLKRPASAHPRMAPLDRAAQFLPFAALTGYEEAIQEAGRITCERREEDEGQRAELDERLRLLADRLPEQPEVVLTRFVPDEKKDGGAYRTFSAVIKRIDAYRRALVTEDGQSIPIDDIVGLEGAIFKDIF